MRVGPDRVHVAGRPRRVGQGLLGDQDERPLGHPARTDVGLGGRDLLERPADVDGAGAAGRLVGPGDAAADGQVDLVGRRAVPPPAVRTPAPRRELVAEDVGDRAGAGVEQGDPCGGQVRPRRHGVTGDDGPAELAEQGRERAGDARGAPFGDRPAVLVPRGEQHGRHRGRGEAVERPEHVRRRPGEQRPRLRGAEPPDQEVGRQARPEAEPRHPQRVVGPSDDRAEDVLRQVVEAGHERRERTPPGRPVHAEAGAGLVERAHHHARGAVVEGVREVDLGVAPDQAVLAPAAATRGTARRRRTGAPPSRGRGSRPGPSARRSGCRRRSCPRPRGR